jgi:hypothetical protein
VKGAQRIVSLAPSITEILFALGLGERVVGVTALCDYPPEARTRPKVGDANISPERVVALKPDLVVAHELLNSRVIPTLRRLKLRVLSANPKDFDKLFAFILQIGEAAGVPERARQAGAPDETAHGEGGAAGGAQAGASACAVSHQRRATVGIGARHLRRRPHPARQGASTRSAPRCKASIPLASRPRW